MSESQEDTSPVPPHGADGVSPPHAPLTTVIGRGHGGTRAMSHTLAQSGVFMGEPNNGSGDLVPAEEMYEATRLFGRLVKYTGNYTWDFSDAFAAPVDPGFERLVRSYLHTVLESPAPRRGWKLPETTLVFPWIQRMFPDAWYIGWVRDARDSILGGHLTDDIANWGVEGPETDDEMERRAISWLYQVELVRACPKPPRWIAVRFEDFVLDQEATLRRLEGFLGLELARIEVRPESVGRWRRQADARVDFPFLRQRLAELGYGPG